MVMSAVSSVSTFGVFVTVMPLRAAASTSMWSVPFEKLAISFSCGPASSIRAASIRSVTVGTSTSALLTAAIELGFGARHIVDIEFRIEELAHARLDRIGQLPRDVDLRFFLRRHVRRR